MIRIIVLVLALAAASRTARADTPLLPGFPSSASLQFTRDADGHRTYRPGDKVSYQSGPHAIIGNIAGDKRLTGTVEGIDEVYYVLNGNGTRSDKKFVQFYCSKGEVTLPDNVLIRTDLEVVDQCPNPNTLAPGEICVPNACNYDIPTYSNCQTPGCCKPAIVRSSGFLVCHARCGDGEVQDDEQCDDGNRTDGDGCDADCQIEEKTPVVCNDQPLNVTTYQCATEPIDVSKHVGICSSQPLQVTQNKCADQPVSVSCPQTSCPHETLDSFYGKCPHYFQGETGKPVWNCAKIENLPMKGRRAKQDAAEICGAIIAKCIEHGITGP